MMVTLPLTRSTLARPLTLRLVMRMLTVTVSLLRTVLTGLDAMPSLVETRPTMTRPRVVSALMIPMLTVRTPKVLTEIVPGVTLKPVGTGLTAMRLMGVNMSAMVVVRMLTGVASQSRMMLMVLTATVLSVVLMLSLAGIGLTVMRPRGTSVFVMPMGAARTLMVPSVIGLLMVMALTLVETRRTLMRFRVVTVPTRVMVTGLMRTLTVTLSLARTTPMPLTVPSMMRLAVMVTQMLSLVMVSRMVTVLGRILTRNR